jgi:RsiW-degrading membrane proteinase PrsW (M82 family)
MRSSLRFLSLPLFTRTRTSIEMDRALVFLAATAPGLLFLTYGVTKTRASFGNEALWTAFLVSAVASIAAALGGYGLLKILEMSTLGPVSKGAIESFFIAGTIEEAAKFAVVVGVAERHVDARRVQDVIALAIAAALGFATMENLLYVATPGDWHAVAGLRAITAVPGHAVDGLIMGALITAARLHSRSRAVWLAAALLVPIMAHGAYDFPLLTNAFSGTYRGIFWLIVLVTSAVAGILLCNFILPGAATADRISGRDISSPVSPVRSLFVSAMLILGGPVIGVFSVSAISATDLKGGPAVLWGAGTALSILPVAFGMDLMWSFLRQWRGQRKGSRIAVSPP